MTDDARVIPFPAWRRTTGPDAGDTGGTGEGEVGPAAPGSASTRPDGSTPAAPVELRPRPRRDGAAGLDVPVWHEGDSTTGDVVVTMRVDVLRARPPIWRRLQVRGSITLDRLHPVLTAAFDWPVEGEYRFREVIRDERSTRPGRVLLNPWTRARATGPAEWTISLGDMLTGPRTRLRYTYGRGRGFDLNLVAEDVAPVPPTAVGEVPGARLLTGRRRSPDAAFGTIAAYALALRERGDTGATRAHRPPHTRAARPHVRTGAEAEALFATEAAASGCAAGASPSLGEPATFDRDLLAARVLAAGEDALARG